MQPQPRARIQKRVAYADEYEEIPSRQESEESGWEPEEYPSREYESERLNAVHYDPSYYGRAGSEVDGYESDGRSYYPDDEVRVSVMDIEKSEVARENFVRKVEAMFDQNGREVVAGRPVRF